MPTIQDTNYDEQLKETVGADSSSTFETGGNDAGSNPTEHAGSESLYAAAGLNAAGKTAPALDEEEDDDDDEEDEEDDDDDLEDDDLDDEDEDDDEVEDDDDDDDDDDDEDEEDDDTLKTESSDSIRGRATVAANTVARRRV